MYIYIIYTYIYIYIYIYILYIYIYIIYINIVATNFTMVLYKPLVPSVYVLLYFGLFVYRDCMFYSM